MRGPFRSLAESVCVITIAAASATTVAAQTVQTIEINQGIGVQKNGNLKFVAGRDTVVRAFMSAPVTVNPSQTTATVTRDGSLIATLTPRTYSQSTAVVDFLCSNRAACGNWSAGSYAFSVTVNGASRTTEGTYAFVNRAKLRVRAVPVRTNYNGVIVSVSGDAWKFTWEYVRNVFPSQPMASSGPSASNSTGYGLTWRRRPARSSCGRRSLR
jgi:hypothetical protein